MYALGQIKSHVEHLAVLIGARGDQLPTYGHSEQTGRPHIEVDIRGYHYVAAEGGSEFHRWTTHDLDALLYAVFRSVTFAMASEYELHHRIAEQDYRRLIFKKQIELISVLSLDWGGRLSHEQDKILELYPFDDAAQLRAALAKQLRDQGQSGEDSWRAACEKYPVPPRGSVEDGRQLMLQLSGRNDFGGSFHT